MQYTVIGATGNTGRLVVEDLLKAGHKVRAVARTKDKLASLSAHGADAFEADILNQEALKRSLDGARAAYVMIPPNFGTADFRRYQDEVTDNLCDALASVGVQHVVSLSSIGANHATGVGPVNGLHYLEKQLDGIPDLNTLHLRAGFFMENTFGSLGLIKKMGIYGAACPAEALWPFVATADIGHYAAKRLTALNFNGKNVQYVLGPRDIAGAEVAKILGSTLGIKDLPYVEFTLEQMKQGLVGAGVPEKIADLFCELYAGFNSGLLDYKRNAESTTSTKFEDFVMNALKPAYDAM